MISTQTSQRKATPFANVFVNVRGRKKIVLFHPPRLPGKYRTEGRLPLELLSISGLPMQHGFEIVLIDGSIEPDYQRRIAEEAEDALCVGLFCIIGWQTYAACQAADAVRKIHPNIPLIWGGWFPSVHTEMVLRQGPADMVVRGQGKLTFLEFVEALRNGEPTNSVLGTSYLDDDMVMTNPSRAIVDLNKLPSMPYELLDFAPFRILKATTMKDCALFSPDN